MAIKVIKHGTKTKFTKTCPTCSCEFEYELGDLQTDWTICLTTYPCQYHRYIVCPECGERIYHDTYMPYPQSYPNIIYTTGGTGMLDCDKCVNKPDPNKPIFGDTACTWCKKNVPYCTCVAGDFKVDPKLYTNTSATYTNLKLADIPNYTTTYTTNIK